MNGQSHQARRVRGSPNRRHFALSVVLAKGKVSDRTLPLSQSLLAAATKIAASSLTFFLPLSPTFNLPPIFSSTFAALPPILSSSSAGQQPAAFVFAFLCCLLNPVLLATRGCQQRYLSPTSLPTFCLYRPKNPSTMSYGGGYSNRNGGSNGYSNGYDKSGGYGGSYGASNNYSHGYANIPKG